MLRDVRQLPAELVEGERQAVLAQKNGGGGRGGASGRVVHDRVCHPRFLRLHSQRWEALSFLRRVWKRAAVVQ